MNILAQYPPPPIAIDYIIWYGAIGCILAYGYLVGHEPCIDEDNPRPIIISTLLILFWPLFVLFAVIEALEFFWVTSKESVVRARKL